MSEIRINPVNEIVKSGIKQSRMLKESMIRAYYNKIVEPYFFENSMIIKLDNDILVIGVKNSIWLQEFTLKKNIILHRINKIFENNYIKNIRFEIKENIKPEKIYQEKFEKFDPEKINLKKSEIEKIEKKIENFDENIREKIKNMMILSKKKEIYLKNHNYKKCKNCGIYFYSERDICINCFNEKIHKERETLYGIIKNIPFIKYEDLKDVHITKEQFLDIRAKIKDEIQKKMMDEINNDNIDAYRKYARIYFMIETQNSNEREIENLVNNYLKRLIY
ncbi:MAG: Zn-ribbon-containing, RNA-binding protein and derivative [Fusobacteriales bacterium]|nr:Zn-ribbon-containing, RNA-binding protein and derivative [Fusobacteriales bacterium]